MRNKGLALIGLLLVASLVILYLSKTRINPKAYYNTSSPEAIIKKIEENMVFVQGDSFTMGSKMIGHKYIDDENEKPAHNVSLSSFYIAKYAVTVQDFGAFIQETGYQTSAEKFGFSALRGDDNQFKIYGLKWSTSPSGKTLRPGEADQPAVFTSWYDAIAFCRWLSSRTGRHYRLPTEAEWDYSARGGNKSKGFTYAGSNNFDEVGWSGDNSGGIIHAVGKKKPNELGLYDMSGLIYQWVSDWAFGPYYAISPHKDPKGPDNGGQRVVRGGGWNRPNAMFQRIPLRHSRFPASSTSNGGFRIACDK